MIGVIALLIAILLPALGKARESANSLKCQAQQRQIVAGFEGGWTSTMADARLFYQREVDPNTDKFVSERVAVSGSVRPVTGLSVSGVFSSITAMPRALPPRAFMPSRVAALSVPYALGVTITTRSMWSARWSADISWGRAGSGV